jgi:hypothetical protein
MTNEPQEYRCNWCDAKFSITHYSMELVTYCPFCAEDFDASGDDYWEDLEDDDDADGE